MVNGAVVLVVGGDRAGGMRVSSRGRESEERGVSEKMVITAASVGGSVIRFQVLVPLGRLNRVRHALAHTGRQV
jgi:hypothetical protein